MSDVLRRTLYFIVMIFFLVLAYLFLDRGINTKTSVIVDYQEKSSVNYRVYLKENDIYEKEYLGMDENYIAAMINNIQFDFSYNSLFSREIYGYYSYGVDAKLIAYKDSVSDVLWQKEYDILNDKVMIMNQADNKIIKVNDTVSLDYQKYRSELEKFNTDYGMDVDGYLLLEFGINTVFDFNELTDTVKDLKKVSVMIPLSTDRFSIKILNNYDGIDGYNDFSKHVGMNLLLLIIGTLCLSISISLLVVIVKEFKMIHSAQNKYLRELSKIKNKYGNIIIDVNRFYNKKKYNLIYVSNFNELLDVYKKTDIPITCREVKKNHETIFLIIQDDNAWIYRMVASEID